MIKRMIACAVILMAFLKTAPAQYQGWQHSGSLYILTTPEGANLPATASEENFPLLVRLSKDWFDFSQAKSNGDDIRFSGADGTPLAYQIEEWDVPADYMLQASFQLDPGAALIVGFRQQPKTPASGYRLTIRPQSQEVEIAGPRYVYRRRCPMDGGKPFQVQAFLDGSILECFVNDAYAFTMRGYDFPEGKISLEVSNGLMRFLKLKVKTRLPHTNLKATSP